MLAEAAYPCFLAADIPLGLETARRAAGVAERVGGDVKTIANTVLAEALVLSGDAPSGRALLETCRAAIETEESLARDDQLLRFIGPTLVWIEEYDWARAFLGRIVERGRALSAPGVLPFALAMLSMLDFRTGRWAAAYADASESLQLAAETGQSVALSYSLVVLGRVEAGQGREADCRAHIERAVATSLPRKQMSVASYGASILGFLELGLGRTHEAIAELEDARRLTGGQGVVDPAVVPWGPELVEAYVRSGRMDEAAATLEELEQAARQSESAWSLAAASRARGLLAGEDEFERCFAEAFAHHERATLPFERARTDLCLGERLRRSRRPADAREPLRSALETFETLGAAPWAERARAELLATGETARRRDPSAVDQLTAQELQVALMVAQGATNREAGAALFLSPKTVEAHLSRVYRKLNVRSRTELASLLAHERPLVGAA
jgi:DNA-binding CsgD family transcriptional regulator